MKVDRDTCDCCGEHGDLVAVYEEGIDRFTICIDCARNAVDELERAATLEAVRSKR